jgi:hypothetical protein
MPKLFWGQTDFDIVLGRLTHPELIGMGVALGVVDGAGVSDKVGEGLGKPEVGDGTGVTKGTEDSVS